MGRRDGVYNPPKLIMMMHDSQWLSGDLQNFKRDRTDEDKQGIQLQLRIFGDIVLMGYLHEIGGHQTNSTRNFQ